MGPDFQAGQRRARPPAGPFPACSCACPGRKPSVYRRPGARRSRRLASGVWLPVCGFRCVASGVWLPGCGFRGVASGVWPESVGASPRQSRGARGLRRRRRFRPETSAPPACPEVPPHLARRSHPTSFVRSRATSRRWRLAEGRDSGVVQPRAGAGPSSHSGRPYRWRTRRRAARTTSRVVVCPMVTGPGCRPEASVSARPSGMVIPCRLP